MSHLYDMAKMTVSGTPGTGTFTLDVAVSGFETFADAGAQDGDIVSYSALGLAGWEVGRGTLGSTATTLTRGPLKSSNSNAAVNFGSDVIVWIAVLAEDIIQSVILSGNTAGTSAPIISPVLAFAGGNNITLSGTSNSISIIGPVTVAQSVQTLGLFAVGNTTGTTSSETRDARTLSFDGAGIASVGFSAGSIIISASTAATNPLLSVFAVGNTTSDASSGVIAAGSLSFDGAGIVSVGIAGSSIVISAPSPAASGTIQNRFADGNSFGQSSSAVGTLSSLKVSATGGISAGFSTDASSGVLMLSVAPPVASGVVGNYFASGNTTALSSSSTHTLSNISVSGAGIVSVGVSTTGAGAGILVVSASTAATNPLLSIFAVGNTTSSVSSGVIAAGSLSFDGAGLVSIGVSNSSVVVSAPISAAQSAVGNTTVSSTVADFPFAQLLGVRQLSGSGIISVGYSTVTSSTGAGTTSSTSYTIVSAPNTVGSYAVGNTTGATSSIAWFPFVTGNSSNQISGAGIVSVGYSTATASDMNGTTTTRYEIVSATTAASQGSLSLYAVGNTTISSSTSSVLPEGLSLSGAGIITVGYSSNTILLSATTAASVGSLSLYAVGNTTVSSSTSSALPEALSISGAGIVTVGYSSNTILLSATTAASGVVQNEYAIGNTTAASSSTTQTLSSMSVSGAGIVSVGFSTTGAGAGALVISASTAATNPLLSVFAVGNTTSSVSSGVIAAGSMSFDGAGIVSVGISNSSIVISAPSPAASGVVQNEYAIGNTTAASSSTTQTLSSISISGAGIVSVGYSTTAAGAGALVISASTAATNPLLSLFAVGNTTTSVSSGLNQAGSLSFDGAGIVSVGISGSSVVISAPATGTVGNYFASGNTTAISSSSTHTLSAISISGAGIVSVGVSTTGAAAGILVVSASTAATNPLLSIFAVGNTTSSVSSGVIAAGSVSFDGAGIVSVGVSNSSVVISAPASVGSLSLYAVGNTTVSSSTSSALPEALSISGAGIVTVGYSSNTILFSANSVGSLSLYAVGNTTISSSTSSALPEALSLSGAGIVTVGYSSNTILLSATTAASQGSLSLFAVGNTTGASSSTSSALPEALSFSGSGAVSVGFSSNTIIIAGATVAAGAQSLFAVGNTTSSVSSGVAGAGSLSFDGAGIVSIGVSNSSIVISASTAATNPLLSIYAVGNTTSSVSSGVNAAGSLSFDGAGAISVGVSNSSVVVSSPATSSLAGVSGITLASAASTISIGEQVLSFLEPRPWLQTLAGTWALGTMAVEPFIVPRPLTVNQANFFSSRAVVAPAMTLSSSTASRTVTASATWGSTASLVFYSQQDATSFSSFSSTTASFGMSAVLSASYSSSSKTGSQTVTFGWPQGTSAAVTSSMSTTFSTVSASLATQVMHTSSSLFANWLRNDYPFAASFPPGLYLMGLMWSSASGTSTLSTGLATISGPTWLATNGLITQGPGTSVIAVPGAALSNPFPGVGSTSSAASAVPATIAWQSLSTNAGIGTSGNPVNYFYLNQG